jgi:hypothetical protein
MWLRYFRKLEKVKLKLIKKMKKNISVFFILIIFNSTILSQSGKVFGSLGVGASIPISEFSDGYNIGFNVVGNVGYRFHDLLGIRGDLQYSSFSFKDYTSFWGEVTGDSYSLLTISIDGIIANFSNFKKKQGIIPYGILGAGLYFGSPGNIKLGTLGTVKGGNETYLGIGLGGGAIFKFSRNVGVLTEVKYNTTFGGTQLNYLPFRIAIMFTQ